jgi:hypothetical protein
MALSAQNKAAAKEDYAIIVGISKYPLMQVDGQSRDLDGPANDVKVMTEWLVGQAGVPCENVVVMSSDSWGNNCQEVSQWALSPSPTRNDLYSLLEKHVQQSAIRIHTGNPRIGRRLWVYMAGHGFAPLSATRDICILSADSLPQTLVRNVCLTRWVDWIAEDLAFDEVVMFLDCCAEIAAALTPGLPQAHNVIRRPEPARRLMIAAAQFSKQTFEQADSNGKVLGVFTQHLLKALGGAAGVSNSGHVTSRELKAYFENMPPAGPADGSPALQAKVLEADPIEVVHLGAPHSPSYAVATELPAGSKVKLTNGVNHPVADLVVAADGTVSCQVPIGIYLLSGDGGWRRFFQITAEGVVYE